MAATISFYLFFVNNFLCLFRQLIEYDDVGDSSDLTSAAQDKDVTFHLTDFTKFKWMNVTFGKGDTSIIFNTSNPQPKPYANNTAGSLLFEVSVCGRM
jgi:hypothetical protein